MWRGGWKHAGYEPTRSPGRPTLESVDGATKNGGGGNRTPVPWHFGRSFYVRSRLF